MKTGYNVEAACNNILAGAEGPSADLLVPGTLLEVADEWEQVSTARSSTKPKQGVDRCISTFSKAGLKLRRVELDEACWTRLADVSEKTLLETARQYLHRQRMAKRGQGQPVQNKSAFMISVVHKLSQKEALAATSNGQPSTRKSGKHANSESASESTSLADRSPHRDDAEADVHTAADLHTLHLPDTGRDAPKAAAHSPRADTAVQNQQPASSTSLAAEHDQAGQVVDHRQQQGVQLQAEEDVAFGSIPVADDPGADEGGILFGAAQPEEEAALMFGAPAEAAAEKQQRSIPATEAEPTLGPGPSDAELDPLELHCRRLRQPGYPAGELEVRALAEMLNCAYISRPLHNVATQLP